MLTIEQQSALTAFLNKKWPNSACPMCHVNSWAVNGWITMLVSDKLGIVLGSPVVPIIALSCNNCGNTLMVNAIVAGVMPTEGPPPPPPGYPAALGEKGGANG